MKKMKLVVPILTTVVMGSAVLPSVVLAAEDEAVIVNTEPTSRGQQVTTNREVYRPKTATERNQLPADERALVDALETYFNSEANLNSRSITDRILSRIFVDFAFDIGFNRDNKLFNGASSLIGLMSDKEDLTPHKNWFNSLANKQVRTLSVYDKPTKANITLNSHYIDNGSDTTVAVQHGYRGSYETVLPQAQFFSDLGYNVMLVEARSHGGSQGRYITFGMNESQDLNSWVGQEVKTKPKQKMILYGVSMGASTSLISQEKPQPNVKGIIEDCGYASVEQQFRDIIQMISKATQYVPVVNQIDWYAKEDSLLNQLNDRHLKPKLEMDLYKVSPLKSTEVSGLPTLFIHGQSDKFIDPKANDLLFGAAIGYKEQFKVAGAGHGMAFSKDTTGYKAKVTNFLKNIDGFKGNPAYVAEDVNLLTNSRFETNQGGFANWLTALDNQALSNRQLTRNQNGQYVLEKRKYLEYATVAQQGEGIRLSNRGNSSTSFLGQEVPVVAGQTYEFSLSAKNTSPLFLNYPNLLLEANGTTSSTSLKGRNSVAPKIAVKATSNQPLAFKLGTKVGSHSLFGLATTQADVSNVQIVNADRTPPQELRNVQTSSARSNVTITGQGEPATQAILLDSRRQVVGTVATTDKGDFSLVAPTTKGQYHLVNQDIKGNQSPSTLIVIQ